MPNTLRVLPRGTAMVPHYERAASVGHGRAVVPPHGWRHDPSAGPQYKDPVSGVMRNHGSFERHIPDVIVLPDTPEYRRHLRDRDLWAADEATAQAAGVPYDPTYGGEEELAHHAAPAPTASSWPTQDQFLKTATVNAEKA